MDNLKKTFIEIGKSAGVFLIFFMLPSLMVMFFEKVGLKSEILLTFLAELFCILIVGYIYKDTLIKDAKKMKKFNKEDFKFIIKWLLLGVIIMVISNMLINFLVFKGQIALNESENRELLSSSPFLGLILAGIFAPVLEELTFRRGFRNITKNKVLFVIISTFVFALLHVLTGYLTTYDIKEFLYLIPYGSLGATFAIIYAYSDNIYHSMIAHAIHNTFTLMLIFLASSLM